MKVSVGRFKALLIDWDGTLIDSLPLKVANAAVLFSGRFGINRDDVSASYEKHSGVPRRILFDRISIDCRGKVLTEDEFEQLSSAFTVSNRIRIAADASLRPGVLTTLERLRDQAMHLFVSTSAAQDEIDFLAKHFGLERICTGIFGSRPSFSKGPEHAEHVMEMYFLDRSDLAGIGDDIQDMILFRQAGIFPIGITGTRSRKELEGAGASIVVNALEEVIGHVA